jgi:hypothetical protein
VGNLSPEWRLSGRWLVPVLLAALAFWSAFRRWELFHSGTASGRCSTIPGAMIGPVVLFTVAVLMALQAAYVLPMHRSWPILLVVWGVMLAFHRSASSFVLPEKPSYPEPVSAPVRSTSGTGSLGL